LNQVTAMGKRSAGLAFRAAGLAALLFGLVGCSPQSMLVRGVADQLASQGNAPEEDLVLAREASAFFLKVSESVLEKSPGHLGLAHTVAGGFTQYAYAFVQQDAERLENRDAKAAKQLRERAAKLFLRAQKHALRALEVHHPGLRQRLAQDQPNAQTQPNAAAPRASTALALADSEVGVAYWAAASWAASIALSKDRPDTVADLPLATRLAQLAWQREPGHGQGALASLMGTLESARPGGSTRQALVYFDVAIAAGGGQNAGPFVAKAEAIAAPAGDRQAFETLLRQALQAAATRPGLANSVMRERAQWLLDTADDRF
jgi:predicted anti-sigma-YlaC factor YlaD